MIYRFVAAIENLLNVALMGPAFCLWVVRPHRSTKKDVVCILRHDSIGDFVLFSAALQDYRKHYASSHLILIVRDTVWPLACACPYVDEVWRLPGKKFRWNPFERLKWMVRMSIVGCRLAINAVYSVDLSHFECLIGWTCAPQRVAHEFRQGNSHSRRIWPYYTVLAPAPEQRRHELFRNANLLTFMGFKSLPNLRTAVWLSEADIATGQKLLRTVEGAPFVVIVPGSQMELRRWPAIAFIQMVQELVRRTRLRPVLCGDESERGLCEEIQRSLHRRGIESDVLAGKTNLRELASVTSRAQICIGNETGALHIAAAVGVPVVCLLGGGHYGRFFPYPGTERVSVVTNVLPCFGCDWICQFQEVLCLTGIQVQAVVDKAVTLYESQLEISRK